jgi:acyl-CoA thioesterase FadM
MPAELLALYRTTVADNWIDYNGHANFAHYVVAFDEACDRLMDYFGLGESYRQATNHTMYMLEAHVTYTREVKLGDVLAVETQLIGFDRKRIHFFHRMNYAATGELTATIECIVLHVDLDGPHATDMPPESLAIIERVFAEHRDLPRPRELGRRVTLERQSA